jgi:hypothetical protein
MSQTTPQTPGTSPHSVHDAPLRTTLIRESVPNKQQRRAAYLGIARVIIGGLLVAIVVSTLFVVLRNQDPSRGNHIQDCVDPTGQCRYEQRLQQVDLAVLERECAIKYPRRSDIAKYKACIVAGIPSPSPSPSPTDTGGSAE